MHHDLKKKYKGRNTTGGSSEVKTGLARRGFAYALNAAKFGASVPTISVGMIRDKFSIQKYEK